MSDTKKIEQPLCPLCPEDDKQLLDLDFFGEPCYLNGKRCCSTCYNVHSLIDAQRRRTKPLDSEELQ